MSFSDELGKYSNLNWSGVAKGLKVKLNNKNWHEKKKQPVLLKKVLLLTVNKLQSQKHAIYIVYYMASSVSGQDEPNRALWLATRAGKMEPSCPLGTTRYIPRAKFHQKPYNKSFIDQVCSVKMAGCWPRSFFASLWTSTSSRSINTQKKELGQYPAILTSHLVNNPYLRHRKCGVRGFIHELFVSKTRTSEWGLLTQTTSE